MGAPPTRRAPWHLLERDQVIVYGLALLLLGVAGVRYALSRWRPASPLQQLDAGEPVDYRVDLNRADAAELDLLPGVGPVKAEQIVRYRERHGSFAQLEDLTRVPGFGRDRVERLRSLVTVSQAAPRGEPQR